jgi:hypothetical protein
MSDQGAGLRLVERAGRVGGSTGRGVVGEGATDLAGQVELPRRCFVFGSLGATAAFAPWRSPRSNQDRRLRVRACVPRVGVCSSDGVDLALRARRGGSECVGRWVRVGRGPRARSFLSVTPAAWRGRVRGGRTRSRCRCHRPRRQWCGHGRCSRPHKGCPPLFLPDPGSRRSAGVSCRARQLCLEAVAAEAPPNCSADARSGSDQQ